MAMIHKDMERALNEQLNRELYSSYLYLSMSAFFGALRLPGFAHWMRMQAAEEALHFDKLFDYIQTRGGRVVLDAVARPPSDWESPVEVFRATLDHEEKVTEHVHDLARLAAEFRDRATESFVQWFIDEQVEEEASVDRILKNLMFGASSPITVLMLDRELAARLKPTPPTPAA